MECWGGGAFLRSPSNSAPELRSDMQQAAFESVVVNNLMTEYQGELM